MLGCVSLCPTGEGPCAVSVLLQCVLSRSRGSRAFCELSKSEQDTKSERDVIFLLTLTFIVHSEQIYDFSVRLFTFIVSRQTETADTMADTRQRLPAGAARTIRFSAQRASGAGRVCVWVHSRRSRRGTARTPAPRQTPRDRTTPQLLYSSTTYQERAGRRVATRVPDRRRLHPCLPVASIFRTPRCATSSPVGSHDARTIYGRPLSLHT